MQQSPKLTRRNCSNTLVFTLLCCQCLVRRLWNEKHEADGQSIKDLHISLNYFVDANHKSTKRQKNYYQQKGPDKELLAYKDKGIIFNLQEAGGGGGTRGVFLECFGHSLRDQDK